MILKTLTTHVVGVHRLDCMGLSNVGWTVQMEKFNNSRQLQELKTLWMDFFYMASGTFDCGENQSTRSKPPRSRAWLVSNWRLISQVGSLRALAMDAQGPTVHQVRLSALAGAPHTSGYDTKGAWQNVSMPGTNTDTENMQTP